MVHVPHLLAALALWDYCEASARRIFGRALGDANADGALHAVRMGGEAGMTQTELHDYFSRNMQAKELNRAVTVLPNDGLIRVVRERARRAGQPSVTNADELEESELPGASAFFVA